MKTKNEKPTVFRFPFFYENGKQKKALKIQSKNLLNIDSHSQLFEFHFSY